MRSACLLVILIGMGASSCEREGAGDRAVPARAPAPSSQPAPSTARAAAIAALQAVTRPTSLPTTAEAATQPGAANDPLSSPRDAVAHMFELMRARDVKGVAAMMTDPLPPDALRGEVASIASRLESGAEWEILESRTNGAAALVIFRTTYPDGRREVSPLLLVNRYDRWRVQLGPVNERRFTSGEKMDLNQVLAWGEKRLAILRDAPAATKPAGGG